MHTVAAFVDHRFIAFEVTEMDETDTTKHVQIQGADLHIVKSECSKRESC